MTVPGARAARGASLLLCSRCARRRGASADRVVRSLPLDSITADRARPRPSRSPTLQRAHAGGRACASRVARGGRRRGASRWRWPSVGLLLSARSAWRSACLAAALLAGAAVLSPLLADRLAALARRPPASAADASDRLRHRRPCTPPRRPRRRRAAAARAAARPPGRGLARAGDRRPRRRTAPRRWSWSSSTSPTSSSSTSACRA